MGNVFQTTRVNAAQFLLIGLLGLGAASIGHAAGVGADVGVGANAGSGSSGVGAGTSANGQLDVTPKRSAQGDLNTNSQTSSEATTGLDRAAERANASSSVDSNAQARTKTKKKKATKEQKQGAESSEQQ